MSIFKTLGRMALQRIANDPKLQETLKSAVRRDILPKAQEGWTYVKPELKKIKAKGEIVLKKMQDKIKE